MGTDSWIGIFTFIHPSTTQSAATASPADVSRRSPLTKKLSENGFLKNGYIISRMIRTTEPIGIYKYSLTFRVGPRHIFPQYNTAEAHGKSTEKSKQLQWDSKSSSRMCVSEAWWQITHLQYWLNRKSQHSLHSSDMPSGQRVTERRHWRSVTDSCKNRL